jgi:hypothetical protein
VPSEGCSQPAPCVDDLGAMGTRTGKLQSIDAVIGEVAIEGTLIDGDVHTFSATSALSASVTTSSGATSIASRPFADIESTAIHSAAHSAWRAACVWCFTAASPIRHPQHSPMSAGLCQHLATAATHI